MSRRRILGATVALVMALATAAAVQAAGTPGSPDASAMVLAPDDVPGATVVSQRAEPVTLGTAGGYNRLLKFSSPYGASQISEYDSSILIAQSPDTAQLTLELLGSLMTSKSGASLLQGVGGSAKGLTLSKPKSRKLALGDGATEIDFTVHRTKPNRTYYLDVLMFRVDRVLHVGESVAAKSTTLSQDAVALANLVLGHVKTALAPVATVAPAIAGTAVQGQMLVTLGGTWSGTPTGLAFQWQHCDATGANCTDIAGATAFTYNVTASDVGMAIRVTVTATNAFGSTIASSAATTVVP